MHNCNQGYKIIIAKGEPVFGDALYEVYVGHFGLVYKTMVDEETGFRLIKRK